jgi:hypothetical protein
MIQNYRRVWALEKTEKTPKKASNFRFGPIADYQRFERPETPHDHFFFQSSPR